MYCKNCGTELPDEANFCSSCGANQGNIPNSEQINANPIINEPIQPELPMKWYKFLIYFLLWFSAFINFMSGTSTIGIIVSYGITSDPEIIINLILASISVLVAVYAIIVRFALAGYKAKAPLMLVIFYAMPVIIGIITIICYFIGLIDADVFSGIGQIIGAVVMTMANNYYFKKRAHLFVN